jgi:hypothetical protein
MSLLQLFISLLSPFHFCPFMFDSYFVCQYFTLVCPSITHSCFVRRHCHSCSPMIRLILVLYIVRCHIQSCVIHVGTHNHSPTNVTLLASTRNTLWQLRKVRLFVTFRDWALRLGGAVMRCFGCCVAKNIHRLKGPFGREVEISALNFTVVDYGLWEIVAFVVSLSHDIRRLQTDLFPQW